MRPSVLPCFVVLFSGCELLDLPTSPGAGTPTADTSTTPGPDDSGLSDDPTGEDPGGWSFSSHPCFGNRTDTLWFDDRDTAWVGCGSTTVGLGLYVTHDGGRSWSEPDTTPHGWFDTFRTSSVSRSADGRLYVAGLDTSGSARVVSLGDDGVVVEEFAAGDQLWNSFHVGTFRRDTAGRSVAESLTGTGLVVRDGDDQAWRDGYGWWGGAGSYQLLDLTLHRDRFYGVGSTIGQPPTVFLPPEDEGLATGFSLTPVEFQGFDGELWGLAVDDGGLLAAGVDQDRDVGFVLYSGPDPWELEAWRSLDVSTLVPEEPTWMRGACRSGEVLVAVGEYSRRGAGLVLRSDDGGERWTDLTPTDVDLPAVHRCSVFEDGTLVVTGAEGVFATWTP